MRTIYKHTFDVGAPSTWEKRLQAGAVLLHVAAQDPLQNELVHTWWEVETDNELVDRSFKIVGTGHPVPPGYFHLGSALSGPYVWHLYEPRRQFSSFTEMDRANRAERAPD